jgi:hypothetical protein
MLSRTRLVVAGAAMTAVSLLGVSPALAQGNGDQASRPAIFDGVLWADGELYGTNLNGPLPAPNANNRQSFDDLYQVTNGVEGQRPVAEAAPGPGYNGGRWAVVALTWTDGFEPVELTSSAQVDHYLATGALTATEAGVYFSCPLLPVK